MNVTSTENTHLLTRDSTAVNQAGNTCRKVLYSGIIGGAAGCVTGLALSGLFYANGAPGTSIAVAAIVDTVAASAGAVLGTITRNVLAKYPNTRRVRAIAGACGTAACLLSIFNATALGISKALPVWMQFAVGLPAALAGGFACAYPRERLGNTLTGFTTAVGSGSLLGFTLGAGIGAAVDQVGFKTGAVVGMMGMQSLWGYITPKAAVGTGSDRVDEVFFR